jgi:hypothetical protein
MVMEVYTGKQRKEGEWIRDIVEWWRCIHCGMEKWQED